ncbi:MAG: alpha-glucosidase [Acholeplasmataceae bacterium]|nr:alpha-glucosidase [Acholeplasmataceae bacterium]
MQKKWWMESVGYQIYPKTFYDSNHDGFGDILGIYEKLEYLNDLGVNLIWICPFYDSPMDDNGYDVRDFFKVYESFGKLEDVKKLLDRAHELGIKVIMDFVLNHTSDEHPWFIESRKSKDNPYRDYYIWHDGKVINDKKVEPTNWGSFFGGSCWNYDELTDSYYMKIFSNKMPDLNWKNPKVQQEIVDVGKWWLDFGMDGFRIDAVSHLDRDSFVDIKNAKDKYPLDWHKFSNLPKVHDYLKMLNKSLFTTNDALTIGEVGGQATIKEAIKYAGFNSNELSMVFNFDHNWCNNLFDITNPKKLKTNVVDLKKTFNKWQHAFKDNGWVPLNWLNHDQPRLMSQYGDYKFPLQSGKMLATALYLMRGTPFIYQGEEIGMTNYPFEDVNDFDDISSRATYTYELEKTPDDPVRALKVASLRSRDNARTAMQWNKEEFAGFSDENPKVLVNRNYKKINVETQLNDQKSLLNHYKKIIHLRRFSEFKDLIVYGSYEQIDIENEYIYVYKRIYEHQTLLVINSFSRKKQVYQLNHYDIKNIVISNYDKQKIKNQELTLRPFESIVFEVKEKL